MKMMKKMKLLLFLLCIVFISSCGKKEKEDAGEQKLSKNQIYVYLVNSDKTDIVRKVYTLDKEKKRIDNVDSIMKYLSSVERTEDYQTPIPEGISYISSSLDDRRGGLKLSFSVLYDAVDADTLVFFKCCVVNSLFQLEGVNSISLSMTDLASSNEETATVVENFDQDSFVMSFGEESGYKQPGTIILYFANESGEALKEYRKSIEILNNTSLARIVVESLIEGPEKAGYMATLSEYTTVQNISVKDGICYVDLSDEFYNTDNPLKNDIIVYSIVNSLVELPTVSKVQFLKNGERQPFFRETMSFDGIFERNLDLIEQEDTEE